MYDVFDIALCNKSPRYSEVAWIELLFTAGLGANRKLR
jgi:hypothetical protein